MTTFAQIISGKVFDPQPNATEAEYRARNPVFAAAPVVAQLVDDNAAHGATYNGGGNYTNPSQPAPFGTQKRVCTPEEVIDLIPAAVIKSLEDSTNATVIKRYRKFLARTNFTYAQGVELGDDLEGATLFTAQQNNDFRAAWPEA